MEARAESASRRDEAPDGLPLSASAELWRLALSLVLLALAAGILLFLLLVVLPSAGAAGGCGGG
jgi:hypothetical protein